MPRYRGIPVPGDPIGGSDRGIRSGRLGPARVAGLVVVVVVVVVFEVSGGAWLEPRAVLQEPTLRAGLVRAHSRRLFVLLEVDGLNQHFVEQVGVHGEPLELLHFVSCC